MHKVGVQWSMNEQWLGSAQSNLGFEWLIDTDVHSEMIGIVYFYVNYYSEIYWRLVMLLEIKKVFWQMF